MVSPAAGGRAGSRAWRPSVAAPGRPKWSRLTGDAGVATVEIAACLPALALLLMVGLGALGVVRDQIGCVAAAREVALAAARGASPPPVAADVVEVSTDGDVVRVVVRRHRDLGLLPGFDITATAVAAIEPDE